MDHSIANNVMQHKGSFRRCRVRWKWDRPGRGWRECTARGKCNLRLPCCCCCCCCCMISKVKLVTVGAPCRTGVPVSCWRVCRVSDSSVWNSQRVWTSHEDRHTARSVADHFKRYDNRPHWPSNLRATEKLWTKRWPPTNIYTVSQKTSHLWLAITSTHVNGIWYFWQKYYTEKVGNRKTLYYVCHLKLLVLLHYLQNEKHENCIFHSLY